MSKIFELFGFRLDNWSAEAKSNCAKAWCPFMNAACDGGGNRYLSAIDLRNHPKLAEKFPGKNIVQAGVCSWIDDFPADPVVIVEIMTSSTSGGDKNKRTQIGMAFEDAVLDRTNHNGSRGSITAKYGRVWLVNSS